MYERTRRKRKTKPALLIATVAAAGMMTLAVANTASAKDINVRVDARQGNARGYVEVNHGSRHEASRDHARYNNRNNRNNRNIHNKHVTVRGHASHGVHREYNNRGRGHANVVIHRPHRVHQVWVSGHYRYRNEKFAVRDGYYESRWVPPVIEEKCDRHGHTVRRVIRAGHHEKVWIPAVMGVRKVRVWVPGHYVTP